MCVQDCNNVQAIIKRFCRGKILYDYCRFRKCYSETNIHELTKSLDVIDVKSQTCDDMYLAYYCNRSYQKYFQNMQDIEMHPVVQESFKTRLHIMSRKDMYIYDQKDWEKQQMKMMEEGFYDLSIKQHVEKEFCIPFNDGDTNHSKGASQKPQYYDLHSLSIGPLKVSAKYDRGILPKLRVIFTAKKFTYEYELRCGMTKNHEPDPCMVRSVSGHPLPQLLLTVDIPFKTVQALAIQSNKKLKLKAVFYWKKTAGKRGPSSDSLPQTVSARTTNGLATRPTIVSMDVGGSLVDIQNNMEGAQLCLTTDASKVPVGIQGRRQLMTCNRELLAVHLAITNLCWAKVTLCNISMTSPLSCPKTSSTTTAQATLSERTSAWEPGYSPPVDLPVALITHPTPQQHGRVRLSP
nr:uncharacterized protein LOC113815931 [Penaeus vannamei]